MTVFAFVYPTVAKAVEALSVRDAVLDGEIVALDSLHNVCLIVSQRREATVLISPVTRAVEP